MKIYEKGEVEESLVTFDIDKEFQRFMNNDLFVRVLKDSWELKKVLLSTKQIKDLEVETGIIKTIYRTGIWCNSLSTYCKVLILSVAKKFMNEELIIPYELFYYQMFADELMSWFNYNDTSIYLINSNSYKYFNQ